MTDLELARLIRDGKISAADADKAIKELASGGAVTNTPIQGNGTIVSASGTVAEQKHYAGPAPTLENLGMTTGEVKYDPYDNMLADIKRMQQAYANAVKSESEPFEHPDLVDDSKNDDKKINESGA